MCYQDVIRTVISFARQYFGVINFTKFIHYAKGLGLTHLKPSPMPYTNKINKTVVKTDKYNCKVVII